MYSSSRLMRAERPEILGRRFDCMESILRLLRCDMFCRCMREGIRISSQGLIPWVLWSCSSLAKALPNPSKYPDSQSPVRQSTSVPYISGSPPTLIRFAANSKFLSLAKPSSPSIFCILFCTKYISFSSLRWSTFLMCLILLKLRSKLVRCMRLSKPLICDMRLSYRSISCSVGPRFCGSSMCEIWFWRRHSFYQVLAYLCLVVHHIGCPWSLTSTWSKRSRCRAGMEEIRQWTRSMS